MALSLIQGGKSSNEEPEEQEEVNNSMETTVQLRVFRLSTGEDIMAKVVSEGKTGYWIEEPLLVVLREGKDGGVGIEMVPFFMPYAAGTIKLPIGSVVAVADTVDDRLLANYRQFFSPIIQPPVQGITLA